MCPACPRSYHVVSMKIDNQYCQMRRYARSNNGGCMKALISRIFGLGMAVVDWKATIYLTVLRSAAGGFACGCIVLFFGGETSVAMMFMIFGSVIGTLIYVPIGIIFAAVARIFPPAGLACLPSIIYMAAGDPILWGIRKFRSDLLPIEKFNVVNFNTVIFVINQDVVDTVRDGVTSEVGRAASSAVDRLSSFKRS